MAKTAAERNRQYRLRLAGAAPAEVADGRDPLVAELRARLDEQAAQLAAKDDQIRSLLVLLDRLVTSRDVTGRSETKRETSRETSRDEAGFDASREGGGWGGLSRSHASKVNSKVCGGYAGDHGIHDRLDRAHAPEVVTSRDVTGRSETKRETSRETSRDEDRRERPRDEAQAPESRSPAPGSQTPSPEPAAPRETQNPRGQDPPDPTPDLKPKEPERESGDRLVEPSAASSLPERSNGPWSRFGGKPLPPPMSDPKHREKARLDAERLRKAFGEQGDDEP